MRELLGQARRSLEIVSSYARDLDVARRSLTAGPAVALAVEVDSGTPSHYDDPRRETAPRVNDVRAECSISVSA